MFHSDTKGILRISNIYYRTDAETTNPLSGNPVDDEIDSDNDGLIDISEILGFFNGVTGDDQEPDGKNNGPEDEDSDNDGLLDGEEVLYWISLDGFNWDDDLEPDGIINILDQDSDGDTISDGDELDGVSGHITHPGLADTDGDSWEDNVDEFPLDSTEWVDTDNDGTGNNADTDDDGDGMPDTWENTYGLDPLDDSDASGHLDTDQLSNLGEYNAGTLPNDTDSDNDGLDDCWEENGDFWNGASDSDKKALWTELSTAGHAPDPTKQDIYVEVDWMEEGPIGTETIDSTQYKLIGEFIVEGEFLPLWGLSRDPTGSFDYDFYLYERDADNKFIELTVEEDDGVYILTEDFTTTTTEPADAHYIYLKTNTASIWNIEYFNDFAHELESGAKQSVISAFSAKNIVLHIDDGTMNGGNEIPHSEDGTYEWKDPVSGNWNDFEDYYDNHFASRRQGVFHYCIFAHDITYDGTEVGGVANSGHAGHLSVSNAANTKNIQAKYLLHELGHTIGLHPADFDGIDDDLYTAAQYPSVMNYNVVRVESQTLVDYSDGPTSTTNYDDWGNLNLGEHI
jgi:hypothetical protein